MVQVLTRGSIVYEFRDEIDSKIKEKLKNRRTVWRKLSEAVWVDKIMFVVLYRWRVKPEFETQFVESWSEITAHLRSTYDSLGSRLHRGNDGLFYAYAQWKSADDRKYAFANAIELEAGELMKDAIAESLEPIVLENLADFLVLPEKS